MAYANRFQTIPAKQRVSALKPVGPGQSYVLRPEAEWIGIPIPAIVTAEEYQVVQAKLAHNQQFAARNTHHAFLLQGLVSCGACGLTASARTTSGGYQYYVCRGRQRQSATQ